MSDTANVMATIGAPDPADPSSPSVATSGDAAGRSPAGVGGIEGRTPFQLAWQRLRRDRVAMVSLAVIVVIVLMAFLAPLAAVITGHPVNEQYRTTGLTPEGLPRGPSSEFWLGTDDLGRDILVRIAYGSRISLLVGVASTALTVAIGVVIGLTAGFLGGVVDTVLARLIDVVLSVPFLLVAIALVSITGPSLIVTVLVIGFFSWASVARIVRGQVLSMREREFVEATLSFLGLGLAPPTADWGGMISEAQNYYTTSWWFVAFPGAALLVTTLAFNLLGDGIRDAFDPRAERLMAK